MATKKKKVTLDELGEMLTHVVTNMATKEDVTDLRTELAEVKSELAIVRKDVAVIKADTESNKGFSKEIDHTISRVVVIEKHLGISA